MKRDLKGCMKCKNAVLYVGAYTGIHYLECRLTQEDAENMTLEQLEYAVKHPEENRCDFINGAPKNGGVTYDD